MKPKMYKMIASCPNEITELLVSELKKLGAQECETLFKAVSFQCTEKQFYQIHLKSAQASSLYWVIKECSAHHKNMLHSQAQRISWNDYFSSQQSFRVDAIAGDRGEKAMSGNEISKQIIEYA